MKDLNDWLRYYADCYETKDFILGDPSWFMHQVSGDSNCETMAFIASALSFGSRKQFMPKIQTLLDLSGGELSRWVTEGGYRNLFSTSDRSCFYRMYNMQTMRYFFDRLSAMLRQYGSIGAYLRNCRVHDGMGALEAICGWFDAGGGVKVVPHDTSSCCKRLCMFLRWMVRDHSPVDMGLWVDFIDKRTLVMPLDTHVLRVAFEIGLLNHRCASMAATRKLTDALAVVFPDDPLKGDFALFGYGVAHPVS